MSLVLPTQVLNPVVELDEDGSLSMESYLWLSRNATLNRDK